VKILNCGGAGYIGSHTTVELLAAGHEVVVFDNLSNSSRIALQRIEEITSQPLQFVHGDIRDAAALDAVMASGFDAVIHFAALKAVGESTAQPLRYYENNVSGSLCLLQAMQRAGIQRMIFSSSATVYGDPSTIPVTEDAALSCTNPYGRSKPMVEEILRDLCRADAGFSATLLRYFNPVGAHSSGRIGEDPHDTPNNLMPYVSQVAVGRRDRLSVYGGDYPTPDGTGVRDYIHVVDLARAHVKAVERCTQPGPLALNLGTGRGYSVLEVVAAFERASGRQVPYTISDRRAGDVAAIWAAPALAEQVLDWRAEFDLDRMCVDAWRWQSTNPEGFADPATDGSPRA
jgi:UDP-glucose 4-epimerase